jgi:tripeptide aminopeptidase
MNTLTTRLIDLAIAIQQIPAPTFHEAARAEFVRSLFIKECLEDVKLDETGNVYARLAGSGQKKGLVVSAHLDTVFTANVDLNFERQPESRTGTGTTSPRTPYWNRDNDAEAGTTARIRGPGIGDNSLGVAGLFGLAWALQALNLTLPGDLWLVANVCEEGLGNLRGMRAVVDHFGSEPIAYIALEGMSLGQIFHRGLGVRRTRITVRTSGGHAWIDHDQPSAIHELTKLANRITALSRTRTGTTTSRTRTGTNSQQPRKPLSTLNIGIISGGSSINTIAAEAMLELDLRSESDETLEALARQVEQIARAAQKPGVKVEVESIGQRPSGELPAEHPLVRLAEDCLRLAGVEPHLNTGSTDANLPLSQGLPAITIGLTSGGRAHSVDEYINLAPLEKGMAQLTGLVRRIWEVL